MITYDWRSIRDVDPPQPKLKTWRDVEIAALHDPALLLAVRHVARGDCTREEALIAVVLWFADRLREQREHQLEMLKAARPEEWR